MKLGDFSLWWLRRGETAATVEGDPVTFDWDDGSTWGCKFRGKPVLWDHSAGSAIGGLEAVWGDSVGAALRDVFKSLAGHGFTRDGLTRDQQRLLDATATAMRGLDSISGRQLRLQLDIEEDDFDRLKRRLQRSTPIRRT